MHVKPHVAIVADVCMLRCGEASAIAADGHGALGFPDLGDESTVTE